MYVQKLPSGKYRAQVKVGGDQRWTAAVATQREAKRLAAELLLDMGGGGRTVERHATVNDMLAASMAEGVRRWSPTFTAEATRVADALPATFLARRARDVTPPLVAGLWRQLEREGWGGHRIKRAHTILSKAWNDGITYGWVTSNPIRHAPTPQLKPRQVSAPDTDTVARIINAGATPLERLALRMSATTGARRGEVVAVQWDDVDVDGGWLLIRRSLVWTPKSGMVERDTKTGAEGHRRVPLDRPTVSMLRKHRHEQRELALATRRQPPHWVFSDDAGVHPWRPDRLTNVFIRARERVGVTGVRLHDLRHYVATTMLQDGEAVIDVAAQLGHRSMQTTQTTYAHYMPGRGRESVDRRAARLGGGD